MYQKLRIALGGLLLIGGCIGTGYNVFYAANYFSQQDWLHGFLASIAPLGFIYVGLIGFKLIQNKVNVFKQAKWIFLLQSFVINIPDLFIWNWSTGLRFEIDLLIQSGFSSSLLDTHVSFFSNMGPYLKASSGLWVFGVNFFALILAWLVHKVATQHAQSNSARALATQPLATVAETTPSANDDFYVQAYQELQSETQHIATWAKALAVGNGDQGAAEANYLRLRVESLQAQAGKSRQHETTQSVALSSTASEVNQQKITIKQLNPQMMNAMSVVRFILGMLLLFGAIAGTFGALEGIFYTYGNWSLAWYVLYLLAFIYIGVIGFKLSGHFGNVIQQAKWIFLLQVPILTIPDILRWDWSTGVAANISYEYGDFFATLPMLQEVHMNFHYLSDKFSVGMNLAALLFAYLLHWLSQCHSQPASHTGADQALLINVWSLKKKLSLGVGATLLAILMIMFSGGMFTPNTSDESPQQAVEESMEQAVFNENPIELKNGESNVSATSEPISLGEVHGLNPDGDGFLAMRESPDSNSAMIVKLLEGDAVEIYEEKNGWLYVKVNSSGKFGWCNKQWIRVSQDMSSHTSSEKNSLAESAIAVSSKPLHLETIENKPLCVGDVSLNCNFRPDTMQCLSFFNFDYYGAPTKDFCKSAAEDDGNLDMKYVLARLYQMGVFGSDGDRQAAQWYEKAASQGHAEAQNNLGVMYYYGRGVEKDIKYAIELLGKSAAQGNKTAQQSLEKIKAGEDANAQLASNMQKTAN